MKLLIITFLSIGILSVLSCKKEKCSEPKTVVVKEECFKALDSLTTIEVKAVAQRTFQISLKSTPDSKGNLKFTLYNRWGDKVLGFSSEFYEGQQSVTFSVPLNLPEGVYVYSVMNEKVKRFGNLSITP